MKHMGVSRKTIRGLVWAILLAFSVSATSSKQISVPLFPCKMATSVVETTHLHLFILVDDSASAIIKDRNGEIRSAILRTVVEFSVGYGWLENNPPFLHIYKYSTAYQGDGNTAAIYPTGRIKLSTKIDDLEKTLESIDNKLEFNKTALLAENLPNTLEYISEEIEDIPDEDTVIVILITQGVLEETGDSTTQIEKINLVNTAAKSIKAQIAVFMFEDDGTFEDWKKYFAPTRNAPDSYFHKCCEFNGANVIEWDRNVWNGMIKFYEENNFFNGRSSFAKLPSIAKTDAFPSNAQNIKVVSLRWPQEDILIAGSRGSDVSNSFPNLVKFEVNSFDNQETSVKKSISNEVSVIYTCDLSNTTVAPTDVITEEPALTQEPPFAPNPDISYPTVGGLLAFVILLILAMSAGPLYRTNGLHPITFISVILTILNPLLILAILFILSTDNMQSNIFLVVISYLSVMIPSLLYFFLVGPAQVTEFLSRKFQVDLSLPVLEDLFIKASWVMIALFVSLVIILVILILD